VDKEWVEKVTAQQDEMREYLAAHGWTPKMALPKVKE